MTEKLTEINEKLTIAERTGSLSFGTDAYLLYAYMKRRKNAVGCELGAGSGVISLLAVSADKLKHITAVEVQEGIAAIAAKNVESNGQNGKIDVICRDLRQLDNSYCGVYDTVFTNPPYMRADSGLLNCMDENAASRHELNGTIGDFVACASRILKFGGTFYAVYRPDRAAELIALCHENRLAVKRLTFVHPTSDHVPSILLIEAKKGASDGVRVTPPLIIYFSAANMTNDGYTDDMKYIYEHGDFNDKFR